ncbi:phosphopyruvate hydratase [Pelagibacteraceae bacterium]|nr:phosphopyruvate hydratase [Pelagibacteraceae bacterium]
MTSIKNIISRQILDSRGHPTVETDVILDNGIVGRASVPSGASTGKHESYELRDNKKDYNGKSVLKAVENVNGEIFDALTGIDASDQSFIDNTMIELDGTANKRRLGANAILSVSLAAAQAAAQYYKLPLFKYLGGKTNYKMPTPMFNVINGGAHANNKLSFQEFMIIPVNINSFSEGLRKSAEVFHCLKSIINDRGLSTSVGDEGGFAPNLNSESDALDIISIAIKKAKYKLVDDFVFALDVASTEFFSKNKYTLASEKKPLSSDQFISHLKKLTKKHPIVSIEDPMAEDDWISWSNLTTEIGSKIQIVGDDLFVTNIDRLKKGIQKKSANAILIKLNQIGTLTETIDCIELARANRYETIISHRSGETENTFISDLSVALNCGQIKAGSLSRSDRVAKFNQLLRIEENLTSKKTIKNNRFY